MEADIKNELILFQIDFQMIIYKSLNFVNVNLTHEQHKVHVSLSIFVNIVKRDLPLFGKNSINSF